ncbi:MAG: hypothetical protein R3B13_20705 [Polyangiaceae bacterium]
MARRASTAESQSRHEQTLGRARLVVLALLSMAAPSCGGDDAATEAERPAGSGTGGSAGQGGTGGSAGAAAGGGNAGSGTGGGTAVGAADFVPLHPYRALDTRGSAMPSSGAPACVTLAGTGPIPADAKAVLVNIAAVTPTGAGHFVAYPEGSAEPSTSTVNYASANVANGAIVDLGASGAICVVPKQGQAHAIVDVSGYFTANSSYRAITPSRVVDTRTGAIQSAGDAHCVNVAGVGDVAADAAAVIVNIAAVNAPSAGHLRVHPDGSPATDTSTLNFAAGQTIANGAVVPVGTDGRVCVTMAPTSTHYVLDVTGFLAASTKLQPLTPTRRLDTRKTGRLEAGSITCLTLADSDLPANARGALLNLTAIQPSAAGFAVVYPEGHIKPTTSTINFAAGAVVANNAIVQPGDGGRVCIHTSAATDLVLDVSGFFASTSSDLPCASVSCGTPPPPVCSGGTELITHAATGVCKLGTCIYEESAKACTCSGNAC